MTIGQLIESICGKAATLTGEFADGTPFDRNQRTLSLENAKKVLVRNGFHHDGNEVVFLGHTGRKQSAQIFIGPTFYQRLRHLVDDKIHSRARGSLNLLTRQPVQGFARDGGLRFGEMERDCVIAHGTSLFLMERMLDVSDAYMMHICNQCGLLVSTSPAHPPKKPAFNCSCSTTAGASTVKVPYAAKLLLQELMCMNLAVRIVPQHIEVLDTVEFLPIESRSEKLKITDQPTPTSSNAGSVEDIASLVADYSYLTDTQSIIDTDDESNLIDMEDFADNIEEPPEMPGVVCLK